MFLAVSARVARLSAPAPAAGLDGADFLRLVLRLEEASAVPVMRTRRAKGAAPDLAADAGPPPAGAPPWAEVDDDLTMPDTTSAGVGDGGGVASAATDQGRQVASTAADEGREVASTASDEGRRVASTAADEGREVASTARQQGSQVASTAAEEARSVASTAADRGQQVAQVAVQDARELAGTVKDQAAQVGQELSTQGRNLMEETKTQLEEQTRVQAERLAGTFSKLAGEAQALAEGRPEEAPNVAGYARRAADRLYGAADRLYEVVEDVDSRGLEGLLDDVQTFARRRPAAFLLGAAIAGVGVGRMVRANNDDGSGQAAPAQAPSRASDGRGQLAGQRSLRPASGGTRRVAG
jgi:hypothetical protein